MIPVQLLLFLPALLAMGYAIYRKASQQKMHDAITFLVCGVAVLLNAITMYCVLEEMAHPQLLKYFQQIISAMIVPTIYVFFSAQLATNYNHTIRGALWAMLLLFLLPHVVVFLDGKPTMNAAVSPWAFFFVRDGEVVYHFYTADLIVLIQAIITFHRIPPTYLTLRRYGMRLPKTIYYFGVWWMMAIVFIVFCSFVDTYTLRMPLYNWIYFGSLAFLMLTIYILLAHDLDLRPRLVMTEDAKDSDVADEHGNDEQEELVTDMDEHIEQSRQMAQVVRRLMEEERVYLQSGYTSKDVIAQLGTNRTYFSRMMMAEFGCCFSDWVASERVNCAKQLMRTTNLTLAVIAEQSGFCDATAMSEKFRQYEGVSPSVWRKENRS